MMIGESLTAYLSAFPLFILSLLQFLLEPLEARHERWQDFSDRIPNDRKVHIFVLVDYPVPHPCHIAPGDVLVESPNFRWKAFRCLANDFDRSRGRVDRPRVRDKLLKTHFAEELLRGLASLDDMADINGVRSLPAHRGSASRST